MQQGFVAVFVSMRPLCALYEGMRFRSRPEKNTKAPGS